MNNLFEMIKGEKVEWKELGDVAKVCKGKQLNKSLLTESGMYPAYNGGISFSGFTNTFNVNENTTIISQGGASAGFVQYINRKFWANAHCYYIIPETGVQSRYLFHFLKMKQNDLISFQIGAGIPSLSISAINDIDIPIPSLEIQKKVVETLDKFTKYVTELTSELTDRKMQYAYYRDSLFAFGEEIECKELGDVFQIRNGYTPSKNIKEYWENGNIPWFRMDDIRKNGNILKDSKQKITSQAVKGKLFAANSIIMATTATIGIHALVKVPYLCNQRFTNFKLKARFEDKVDIKFLYYYFYILDEMAKLDVSTSSFPSVRMDKLKKYKIPIPPLEEQERIVSILDKFDTLINDISKGLPAEIEMRNKQYEHYRKKIFDVMKG